MTRTILIGYLYYNVNGDVRGKVCPSTFLLTYVWKSEYDRVDHAFEETLQSIGGATAKGRTKGA
jgi:hypothetical protein